MRSNFCVFVDEICYKTKLSVLYVENVPCPSIEVRKLRYNTLTSLGRGHSLTQQGTTIPSLPHGEPLIGINLYRVSIRGPDHGYTLLRILILRLPCEVSCSLGSFRLQVRPQVVITQGRRSPSLRVLDYWVMRQMPPLYVCVCVCVCVCVLVHPHHH